MPLLLVECHKQTLKNGKNHRQILQISCQILQSYRPFEFFKVRSMRANYRDNQRRDNLKFETRFTKMKYSCLHFDSNQAKLTMPHNNFPFCLQQQQNLKLKYIFITPYSNTQSITMQMTSRKVINFPVTRSADFVLKRRQTRLTARQHDNSFRSLTLFRSARDWSTL